MARPAGLTFIGSEGVRRMVATKMCEACGVEFHPRGKTNAMKQKTCSRKCAVRAQKKAGN